MVTDKTSTSSNNPLEQFVLLAKSAKGAACLELIKQVLEAPGVHVFGELLDMPNVIEVKFKLNLLIDQTNLLVMFYSFKMVHTVIILIH